MRASASGLSGRRAVSVGCLVSGISFCQANGRVADKSLRVHFGRARVVQEPESSKADDSVSG
jgi:hypothetical protein